MKVTNYCTSSDNNITDVFESGAVVVKDQATGYRRLNILNLITRREDELGKITLEVTAKIWKGRSPSERLDQVFITTWNSRLGSTRILHVSRWHWWKQWWRPEYSIATLQTRGTGTKNG